MNPAATLNLQTIDDRLAPEFASVLAGAGVPGFRQALPRLTAEFDRARRHEHALAVALFCADCDLAHAARSGGDGSAGTEIPLLPPEGHGLFPAVLATVLRECTRETDIVTHSAGLGCCILAMPETDDTQARAAEKRLRDIGARRLRFPVRATIATFPKDGWTLEELIRVAEEERLQPASQPSRSNAPKEALTIRSA
jgi:hypothetical protein